MFSLCVISFLFFDSYGQVSGPIGSGSIDSNPLPLPETPWLLLASVTFLVVTLFLLWESSEFQRWATAGLDDVPNPRSGLGIVGILTVLILSVDLMWWLFAHGPPPPDAADRFEKLYWLSTARFNELSPGPLLSSAAAAGVAGFKFLVASAVRRSDVDSKGRSRSRGASLVGALVSVVSLAGSIATLIMFVDWLKPQSR